MPTRRAESLQPDAEAWGSNENVAMLQVEQGLNAFTIRGNTFMTSISIWALIQRFTAKQKIDWDSFF